MAATTSLTMPERSTLNVTDKAGTKGAHPNVLLAYPGVDYDVLYRLIERGLMTGPDRKALERGDVHDDNQARFHLTTEGGRVVLADPVNRLLNSLWMSPQHTMRLDRATAEGSTDLIQRVIDGSYATVRLEDGRPTCLRSKDFLRAREYWLIATHRIRDVLG